MASVRCPDCDASIREEALGEHRRRVHGKVASPRRPLLLLGVLLTVAVVVAGLLLRPGSPAAS
ncbi:MAG: hypothetical protein HY558_07010, partial [Euryarchaeota archaeon]|nr:hypothetical protein [Euryarchaeota archaeon]